MLGRTVNGVNLVSDRLGSVSLLVAHSHLERQHGGIVTRDAKNEERNIERCLKSIMPVADEIIVVDSLSTDKTEEICKNFNVKFISQKWLGYSNQKNFANSLTTNNYILSIDADECLSEELIQSIQNEKNNNFTAQAYDFNRVTFFCGNPVKHCGWNNDYRVRLWKKDTAQWVGDIHELLKFSNETPVKRLSGDMLHYSLSAKTDKGANRSFIHSCNRPPFRESEMRSYN